MRQGRMLAPGWEAGRRAGRYHCVSRVVDRRFVLGKEEKERFVQLMRLYERFCGVRVLSYCVMSNHFHLLVEVPVRPASGLTDRELLSRLRLLYKEGEVAAVRRQLRERRKAGDTAGADAIRERYLYRMWDLSQFMKTLKQRFTQWFNKKHERRDTLWEERFKSVIVEEGYAGRVMAAYIDLNPVRAGLVKNPGDYRWCGYAEAVAGGASARAGVDEIMRSFEALGGAEPAGTGDRGSGAERRADTGTSASTSTGTSASADTSTSMGTETSTDLNTSESEARSVAGGGSWRGIVASYRKLLFADGEERLREHERSGRIEVARRGVSREEAERVAAEDGVLSLGEILRHKVRYFSDGAVIGSRDFVDEVFLAKRERYGARRESGARLIRRLRTPLFAMRDLQVRAIE